MAYQIEYSPAAEAHLRALSAYQRRIVLDAVDEQLSFLPNSETRNRKPMQPNPIALWELRIGVLRVYYDVQDEPLPLVIVRAVGVKERNQIRIGGKVINL